MADQSDFARPAHAKRIVALEAEVIENHVELVRLRAALDRLREHVQTPEAATIIHDALRPASDEARNGIHATPDQGSQPAHTNEERCPDCRTPAGARHYCDKAPTFFIPEAKLASDEDDRG